MASVESTITEEFLTCSICFEIYKDPKTLPCLHSFCKECIDNLTSKGQIKAHPCPICRENFLISKHGAKDMKTNFYLKNLIEFVTSTKEVKKPCSFCSLKGETIDATSRCLTCNDLLCPECAEHRHRSTTLTLHHQVVSLAEVNAGKYHDEIRSKQQIPCFEHKGEDLRFFCETCDVPVCLDCIVLSHQNHKCVTPSDARKQMEENLKVLLNSLDQKLKILTNGKERVISSLGELEEGVKDVKQNLENQSNAIFKNIMESKKRVEEEFDQLVESERNILQQKEKAIQSEKKLFDETLLFCSNIFRCGSDIEILSMKTEMKEHLSKLESSNITETCKVEKIATPVIKFCNSKRCFELFTKMDENRTTKATERAKFVAPQNSETADNVTKELQASPEG